MNRAREFERTIASYRLSFSPQRDPLVEDMRFPRMRVVLCREMKRLERPPSQDEFISSCIAAWPSAFPRDLEIGIRARLSRAYASLVREVHFGLLLDDICAPLGLTVTNSDDLDLGRGIDYLITNDHASVGVAVRQGTIRSRSFSVRKTWRRPPSISILTAELTVTNRMTCGDFWLYCPEWVRVFVVKQVVPALS